MPRSRSPRRACSGSGSGDTSGAQATRPRAERRQRQFRKRARTPELTLDAVVIAKLDAEVRTRAAATRRRSLLPRTCVHASACTREPHHSAHSSAVI